MNIRIENVIWQFAKQYRKKFIANHPDMQISMSIAAVATFRALRDSGHAVEELDAAGNATWKVTKKFPRETGLEPGPFMTFAPEVH
jgi:hypothetical protein